MPQERDKLRIGLLIDETKLPHWAYDVVSRIVDSNYASIELVILNNSAANLTNWGMQPPGGLGSLLYRKLMGFETGRYNPQPNAFKPTDLQPLLKDVPMLAANPSAQKKQYTFSQEDVDKIHQYQLDVIFRVGQGSLKGNVLKAARYGVWAYHHSANPATTEEPFGFWEVLEQQPITGAMLLILGETPAQHQVIYRSYSSTISYSIVRNRNLHYRKSVSFLPRRLKLLYEEGEAAFYEQVKREDHALPLYSQKVYKAPSNGNLLLPFTRHFMTQLSNKMAGRSHFSQWMLMFNLDSGPWNDFKTYTKILPPKDRLWADPFIEYRNGKYYVFIEEALFNPKKGVISVFTMDEAGNYTKPEKIIEQPYHMSYPLILQWQGEDYMIPETSAGGTVELYKCVEWPHKWEFQYNLMEGVRAVDSTLFYHDEKWWLFANVAENEGSNTWDELFLFYADSPISQNWTPHPQNPIISDTTRARPAGNIYIEDGKIYRPSQNCASRYGYGLKINEIVTLNTQRYEEREVHSFEPGWDKNIKAVHTINRSHKLTIIDGIYWRSS